MYLAITVPETLGGAVRKEPGDPNTARLFLLAGHIRAGLPPGPSLTLRAFAARNGPLDHFARAVRGRGSPQHRQALSAFSRYLPGLLKTHSPL